MKYLYKSEKYTFEDYKKFCLALTWKRKPIWIFLIVDVLALLVALWVEDISLFVFAILYFPFFYFLQNWNIKRTYKSNKIMQEYSALEIEFYDTYFIEKTDLGDMRMDYDKLYKIIEIKQYVYLMLGKNQGIMLKKEKFPEGLEEFLKAIKIK